MRICFITSVSLTPIQCGIGSYIFNLSAKLLDRGHEVTVITRGGCYKTQKENFNGIEIYKVTFLPLYPFHIHIHGFFVENLLKSIESRFDIIHFHTPLPPVIKTNLPIITTVHTPMKTDTERVELINPFSVAVKLQGKVSYVIENNLFNLSNKITSVARSVSEELGEYGLNPDDIEVVGNGVDENLFYPLNKKRNEKYILYTGRLTYRKGLFDFIECGKEICAQYPDINLKLTGNGPLLDKLKKMAIESGHKDRFEFLGHVDKSKLVELYQNATIFVQPSHYEGLPTTLLEAMSCGLPVVATSVSGNLDVIENGKNGLLVPPKSPEEMANAVSVLLEDSSTRRDLGRAARRTIEEKFTWDIISTRILQCYNSLIKIKLL